MAWSKSVAEGETERLDQEERRLRERLAAEEALPFLGHHPLDDPVRQALRDRLRMQGSGSAIKGLRFLFLKWPALTVAWIAGCAARSYGTSSSHELYPHLERETGIPWPSSHRPHVAEWFRWACNHLDLPLPAQAEPVDLYVFQGGVPVKQIPRFVDAVEKAVQRVGLPDTDDTSGLRAISEAAANALPPGLPRLQRLLMLDDDGHHVRIWALAREGRIDDTDDPFVQELLHHLRDRPPVKNRIQPPRLLWQGGGPSVRVTGQESWIVETRGWRVQMRPEGRPMEVPLPEKAARGPICWRTENDHGRRGQWPGWDDDVTTAVFDATSGHLRQWIRDTTTIRLEPGIWRLISRSRMSLLDVSWVSEATFWGDLQELVVELGGEPCTVSVGDRRLDLQPVLKPRLQLLGSSVVDEQGALFWASDGLGVAIELPEGRPSEDKQYDLEILLPGRRRILAVDPPVARMVPLAALVDDVEPGLRKLRLALVRRGEWRALARIAGLVWIGLEGFDGSRFRGSLPANLDEQLSRNVRRDASGITIVAPPADPLSRLVFRDVDGRGEQIELVLMRPGVNTALVSVHNGHESREFLDRDCKITVRPGDPRILELRCPDPGARVRVGDRLFRNAFRGGPRFRLPLAAVQLRGSDEIVVEDEHGVDLPIARLQLRLPMGVSRFEPVAQPDGQSPALRIGLDRALEELAVEAFRPGSSRRVRLELVADGEWREDPATGARMRLERDLGHPDHGLVVVADPDRWPGGPWLVDFLCRLPERRGWLPPTNARGDRFTWILDQRPGRDREPPLQTTDRDDTCSFFVGLHRELQSRFAPEAWRGGMCLLREWWCRAAERLRVGPTGPPWERLLPAAFAAAPSPGEQSWLPPCSFWCVFQSFLTLPADHYGVLVGVRHPVAEALVRAAQIRRMGGLVPAYAEGFEIAPEFLGCFANFQHANATGERLRGFRWGAYAAELERANDAETPPRLLSPTGYREALLRSRQYSLELLRAPGHERRKPAATNFAHAAERWLWTRAIGYLEETLRSFERCGRKLWAEPERDEREECPDLVAVIPAAVAALALACRLEPRRAGTLASLFDAARSQNCPSIGTAAHFLAEAGRELFAFDLLLWECILLEADG
jgi:hypothetical protein